MSELTTIARPYAKAAFDFAVEQSTQDKNALGKWTEMLDFLSQLIKDEKIQTFLSGSDSPITCADTIISICDEQLDQYGQNLVKLMAENKRLIALPTVFKMFQHYVEDFESIAEVDVISAKPLTKTQQNKIAKAMEKRLDRKIKLNCSLDKSLIAGIIIRTDSFVIDGSSRGQLDRLANELR